MDNTVYTALNEYYKLKSKYEKNIQKDRMSVIRNPGLTPAQKRQGLQQIVKRCIVCGNIGGTIFTSNNGILKAVCGAKDNPCELNIEIDRGISQDIREVSKEMDREVLNLRLDVIKTKLKYLFGYVNEEDTLVKTEALVKEYNKTEGLAQKIYKEVYDILNNVKNNEEITNNKYKLYTEINILRDMAKEYEETEKEQLINDMVEKYINIIEPLVTKTRNLKYEYTAIECENALDAKPCNDGRYRLVEEPYTLKSLEMFGDRRPTIISNTIGVRKKRTKVEK